MQKLSENEVREAANAKGYDFYPANEWDGRTCALVKRGASEWWEQEDASIPFNTNAAALAYLQSI